MQSIYDTYPTFRMMYRLRNSEGANSGDAIYEEIKCMDSTMARDMIRAKYGKMADGSFIAADIGVVDIKYAPI